MILKCPLRFSRLLSALSFPRLQLSFLEMKSIKWLFASANEHIFNVKNAANFTDVVWKSETNELSRVKSQQTRKFSLLVFADMRRCQVFRFCICFEAFLPSFGGDLFIHLFVQVRRGFRFAGAWSVLFKDKLLHLSRFTTTRKGRLIILKSKVSNCFLTLSNQDVIII